MSERELESQERRLTEIYKRLRITGMAHKIPSIADAEEQSRGGMAFFRGRKYR